MTADEFAEFSSTYYRSDKSRTAEALEYYLTKGHHLVPEHQFPIGVYFFSRIAQEKPDVVRSYEELLPYNHGTALSLLLQILRRSGDEKTREVLVSLLDDQDYTREHELIQEILDGNIPSFQSTLLKPVREPLDLDLLWAEFTVTGETDAVVRIINVLEWNDIVRHKLEEWLGDEPKATWRKRRRMHRLKKEIELLYDEESNRVESPDDLDTRCTHDGIKWDPERFKRVRQHLPFSLSDEELIHIGVKSAARWSLAENASKHDPVLRACEEQFENASPSAKLSLLGIRAYAQFARGDMDQANAALDEYLHLNPRDSTMSNLRFGGIAETRAKQASSHDERIHPPEYALTPEMPAIGSNRSPLEKVGEVWLFLGAMSGLHLLRTPALTDLFADAFETAPRTAMVSALICFTFAVISGAWRKRVVDVLPPGACWSSPRPTMLGVLFRVAMTIWAGGIATMQFLGTGVESNAFAWLIVLTLLVRWLLSIFVAEFKIKVPWRLISFYANMAFDRMDLVSSYCWFRLAADQGNAYGQASLASFYRTGLGVPADAVEAARWYRLAAEQGLPHAQRALAEICRDGEEGVPQDYAEAMKWYLRAAEQGDSAARYQIAEMYGTGQGVEQDPVQALKWLNLAAAGADYAFYREARDSFADSLTFGEVARAEALAREWRSRNGER